MEAKVTSFRINRNLAVVQLVTAGQGHCDFITAARAMHEGKIDIREVNEAGSVNTALVVNRGGELVLLTDADILTGAKQTRVVNTSILLAPHSTTAIPVSCVEQGRWGFTAPGFSPADYTAPSALRAAKMEQVRSNMRTRGGRHADQGEIWARVGEYQAQFRVPSATGSLADIFEGKKETFDGFLAPFTPDPAANGMGVFIGGTLVCVDVFNRADVFREYFPKLVRGAALEAFPRPAEAKALQEAEARFTVLDTLDRLQAAERETFPGVGVGEEERFAAGGMTASALRHGGAMVHLTALKLEAAGRRAASRQRPPRM